MRVAFDFALSFARNEKRGGVHPIIEHQAVGYALADAKIAIEAARYLSWRACHALDAQSPAADELAIQAKIYGSEAAIRVITDLMRVVGIDSYDHEAPLGRLLQDALALPIFDGESKICDSFADTQYSKSSPMSSFDQYSVWHGPSLAINR
jgi:nitroalkane oxidase